MFSSVQPGACAASADGTRSGRAGAYLLTALVCAFLLVQTNLVLLPVLSHFHDGRRILQLLLLAGTALAVLSAGTVRRTITATVAALPNASRWTVLGILLLGGISAARAPVPAAGVREVALFALLVILALAVAAARRVIGSGFDLAVVVTLLASALIYTVIFVLLRHVQLTTLGFESLDVRARHFFYGWSNARFFGQFGVWVLPLLAAAPMLMRDRTVVTRAGAWVAVVVWWGLILEAGGRGSIIVGVLAVGAIALVLGRVSRRWCRDAAVAIVAGTVVWSGAIWLMERVYAEGATVTSSVARAVQRGPTDPFRPAFWREAWEMIAAHPFLGVGPEHYAYHQRAFSAAHPHSAPVQLAAEWGTPVAVAVTVLAAWGAIAWIRRWRGRELGDHRSAVVPALTAALFGAGALALIDGVIVTPASQVMLALVVGWMLAVYLPDRLPEVAPGGRMVRMAGAGLAVTAVGLLAVLVWTAGPYLWSPTETLAKELELHDLEELAASDPLMPRFWVQGRLFDP